MPYLIGTLRGVGGGGVRDYTLNKLIIGIMAPYPPKGPGDYLTKLLGMRARAGGGFGVQGSGFRV